MLSCVTDGANLVSICHLVVEGSSQWILGRNFTRKCNHIHINDNRLQLPSIFGRNDYISMVDKDTHSFVPLIRFIPHFNSSIPPMSSLAGRPAPVNFKMVDDEHPSEQVISLSRPIDEVSKIVKRVHDHVCGHASFGDMRTLLQRDRLRIADVERILFTAVEKCPHCIAAAPPASKRTVSIAGINRQFNDTVCAYPFLALRYMSFSYYGSLLEVLCCINCLDNITFRSCCCF